MYPPELALTHYSNMHSAMHIKKKYANNAYEYIWKYGRRKCKRNQTKLEEQDNKEMQKKNKK